jgi:hypothetical protein
VFLHVNGFPGYGHSQQLGIKLLGSNNIIRNSELQYAASQMVWLGNNGKSINNLIHHVAYSGDWGSGVGLWNTAGGVQISGCTIYAVGRSCVDMSFSYQPNPLLPVTQNLNNELCYNDFSDYLKVCNDGGAIYSWGFRDLTGTRYHHNWFHHAGVKPDLAGAKLDGGQRSIYMDQGSGPVTINHNVFYENFANLSQDASDIYNQNHFEHKIAGSSGIYNNTVASNAGQNISYTTYESSPKDIFRNNIFWGRINGNWGNANPVNETNTVFQNDTVTRTSAQNSAGTVYLGANSVRFTNPLFVGSGGGAGGLAYQLQSGSPARNRATAVSAVGVASGDDCGAYEFGVTPWVPGYKPVSFIPPAGGGGGSGGGSDPTPYLIEAEDYDASSSISNNGTNIGGLNAGDWVRYDVNFAEAKDKMVMYYSRGNTGNGTVEVRLDSTGGTLLATVSIPDTGGWAVFDQISEVLSSPISGVESIFLVFPTGIGNCNIDWLEFQTDTPSGVTNIYSLSSVSPITVPYNTAFGSNGAGVGLPSSVNCVFVGGGTGSVNLTWAIGTYNALTPAYADASYNIVGTPVTGASITNTSGKTVTCNVTVQDMFQPLASPITAIWDFTKLVTNTTNAYGTVNASDDITLIKSLSPGPTNRPLQSKGTAPKLSANKGVFIGTGAFEETGTTTAFNFMSYNATPANFKWTVLFVANITDTNNLAGIMGNNGFYHLNHGFAINTWTTDATTELGTFITNGVSGGAIGWGEDGGIAPGTNRVMTIRVDNSLGAASGKVRSYLGSTAINATSGGNGALSSTIPSKRFELGDMGTNSGYDFQGTMSMVVILAGVESDAVLAKLQSDIAAYNGISL